MVRQLKQDYRQADLPEREKAMLDFVALIAQRHHEVEEADIDRLRGHGFSDADILHIIMRTANFKLANTLTDSTGLEPHENMSAIFVDAPAAESLLDAPGPPGQQERVRPGWERAVVRPLEGLPLTWLNSRPLTWDDVRGRPLLVIFWDVTHSNSLAGLPHWQHWHEQYAGDDLVVLGVHTAELKIAKEEAVARTAITWRAATFPIALDPTYRRMTGANNRFWPATHLIDHEGYVRFRHYGPGGYERIEAQLHHLLAAEEPRPQAGASSKEKTLGGSSPQTPTGHSAPVTGRGILAFSREENGQTLPAGEPANRWLHPEGMPDLYASYQSGSQRYGIVGQPGCIRSFERPTEIEPGRLYVAGEWRVFPEYLELAGASGRFFFSYRRAWQVNLLAAAPPAGDTVQCQLFLDGHSVLAAQAGVDLGPGGQLTVAAPRLYQLFKHPDPEAHSVEVLVNGRGARIYRFSFLPYRGAPEEG